MSRRSERREIWERSGVQARSLSWIDDRSVAGLGLSEDTLQIGEPFGSVRGVDVVSVRLPDLGRDELARLYDESLSALLDRGQSLREEPATVEPFWVRRSGEPFGHRFPDALREREENWRSEESRP